MQVQSCDISIPLPALFHLLLDGAKTSSESLPSDVLFSKILTVIGFCLIITIRSSSPERKTEENMLVVGWSERRYIDLFRTGKYSSALAS